MKIVKEFFETHPGVDEVHEALGVLFVERDRAQAFLAGTEGQKIVTHNREHLISIPDNSEEADKEVRDAFEKGKSSHVLSVDEIPKHDHSQNVKPVIHNDATTYGKTAEEIEAMEKEQAKVKEQEQAAKVKTDEAETAKKETEESAKAKEEAAKSTVAKEAPTKRAPAKKGTKPATESAKGGSKAAKS